MFRRKSQTLSLNRVYDSVPIREGDSMITLRVNSDVNRLVAGITQAQKRMRELNADSTEAEQKDAALYFAAVIFGQDQAEALLDFYQDDPGCVFLICGQYFTKRLAKLIEDAQRKMRV
jgi:hypothetical protein